MKYVHEPLISRVIEHKPIFIPILFSMYCRTPTLRAGQGGSLTLRKPRQILLALSFNCKIFLSLRRARNSDNVLGNDGFASDEKDLVFHEDEVLLRLSCLLISNYLSICRRTLGFSSTYFRRSDPNLRFALQEVR